MHIVESDSRTGMHSPTGSTHGKVLEAPTIGDCGRSIDY